VEEGILTEFEIVDDLEWSPYREEKKVPDVDKDFALAPPQPFRRRNLFPLASVIFP
jgi:hypothetical protein